MLIGASLVLATGAAGCGATTIDTHKAESFLSGAIQPRPRSVSCPRGIRVRTGRSFACEVVAASGTRYAVTLHIIDSAGRVRVSPADVRAR